MMMTSESMHGHLAQPGDESTLAKYGVWIAKLEANLVELARMRKVMYPRLLAAQALSVLGFFVSPTVGLVALVSVFWMCATCVYITTVRGQQFRAELDRTRSDIERILDEG